MHFLILFSCLNHLAEKQMPGKHFQFLYHLSLSILFFFFGVMHTFCILIPGKFSRTSIKHFMDSFPSYVIYCRISLFNVCNGRMLIMSTSLLKLLKDFSAKPKANSRKVNMKFLVLFSAKE
jgi:hypothetical protein